MTTEELEIQLTRPINPASLLRLHLAHFGDDGAESIKDILRMHQAGALQQHLGALPSGPQPTKTQQRLRELLTEMKPHWPESHRQAWAKPYEECLAPPGGPQ